MNTFTNTQNKSFETKCGKTIWNSRSIATCTAVLRPKKEDSSIIQILVVRRGPAVSHEGKWCMPCGYLDRDETITQCAIREVFEETGLLLKSNEIDLNDIVDDPNKDELQNVTFHYTAYLQDDIDENIFQPDLKEVLEIKWIDSLNSEIEKLEWAFNHGQRIKKLFNLIK